MTEAPAPVCDLRIQGGCWFYGALMARSSCGVGRVDPSIGAALGGVRLLLRRVV